jgi:hypothetical protein
MYQYVRIDVRIHVRTCQNIFQKTCQSASSETTTIGDDLFGGSHEYHSLLAGP